ncbi:phosphotransferase [Kribbella sp. NPDC051770]|uniref:phosphotransferase enzyme family protein n=1 Tax=Kribbella sp. NPDC051770 TaxID=3155413 RepID=UPI00343A6204
MLPMGLSMLWERDEPEQALRERFGFEGLDDAAAWVARVLREVWGIEGAVTSRLVISSHNAIVWVEGDRGPLVVKWSLVEPLFERLDATARLLRVLDERGVPVAAPLPALDGRERVATDGPVRKLSVAVLPEVDGDWLDVGDEDAVRASGAALAQLHVALTGYDDDRLPTSDPRKKVPAELLPPGDAKQLVHNDFRAANVLTQGSKVVGVLDFDEMTWGHRVEDLAHASVYLATRFTNWGPTTDAVRRTLRDGYESVRPLTPAEAGVYDALVAWHDRTAGF